MPAAWLSRKSYLETVSDWLTTERARGLCRRAHTSTAAVIAVARVMAEAADGLTGRNCRLSVSRIATEAHCGPRVVQRARAVLADAGFAVEVERGRHLSEAERDAARSAHGGHQIAVASHWCLTLPRPSSRPSYSKSRATYGGRSAPRNCGVGRPTLSPRSGESISRQKMVTKRARARVRGTSSPYPLVAHHAAATLIDRNPGLCPPDMHRGHLVRVLTQAGIDDRWTAWDVRRALEEAVTRDGIVVPTKFARPAGWLAWVLRRIDFTGPTPTERIRATRQPVVVHDSAPAAPHARPATASTRAAARAQFAAVVAARRKERRT